MRLDPAVRNQLANHFQYGRNDSVSIVPKTAVIDYVEVNPMTDHRELTSHVCANLILEFIARDM